MPATERYRRERGSDFIAPTMLADSGHVACSTVHEAWIRLRVHQSGGPAPSKMLDAGTAAMLVNIGPVLLALLGGWLLHEGFPRRLAAGMAVSFGGVLVVGISESDGGRTSVIGTALCLVAAVCYGAGMFRGAAGVVIPASAEPWTLGCGGALAALPTRMFPVLPSLAPGAGYLPGGGVEPVEDVGRGDRQQQCGESFLVVVPGGGEIRRVPPGGYRG
jgi:hypothetical protein